MISYGAMSRLGTRARNEDSFKIWKSGERYMFALADGLGGHKMGDMASRLVVETSAYIAEIHNDDETLLDRCFMEGQKNLEAEQRLNNLINDMKTTQVLLYINNNTARWAHVGDSRLYRFSTGIFPKMAERTLDHSVVQNMVLARQIKEKDIRFHEDRNILLKVMGSEWDTPKYTLHKSIQLNKNDSFLLCTDGFWEMITEKRMLALLKKSATPDDWLRMMEQEILKNVGSGDCDNYTAIAVFCR